MKKHLEPKKTLAVWYLRLQSGHICDMKEAHTQ